MNESSESIVNCTIDGAVATITMDDGKVNLISPRMIEQLNQALNEAQQANAVVVLTGSNGTFSAGFDLSVMKTGVFNAFNMLIGGFTLAKRLLSFPTPVIIGCNGHAVAMGSFLLLSGDYRIGIDGPTKVMANEVAIGLTMPYSAIEICRQRLKPAHFGRATLLSEQYNPQTAVEAGFLDKVVARNDFQTEIDTKAKQFSSLDLEAHYKSKLRTRRGTLKALAKAIRSDKVDFILMGIRRLF